MKQLNFNNQKEVLTETDINELVNLVGYRCRVQTVNRLRSILTYGRSTIPQYGILERLIKEMAHGHIVLDSHIQTKLKLLETLF